MIREGPLSYLQKCWLTNIDPLSSRGETALYGFVIGAKILIPCERHKNVRSSLVITNE